MDKLKSWEVEMMESEERNRAEHKWERMAWIAVGFSIGLAVLFALWVVSLV